MFYIIVLVGIGIACLYIGDRSIIRTSILDMILISSMLGIGVCISIGLILVYIM